MDCEWRVSLKKKRGKKGSLEREKEDGPLSSIYFILMVLSETSKVTSTKVSSSFHSSRKNLFFLLTGGRKGDGASAPRGRADPQRKRLRKKQRGLSVHFFQIIFPFSRRRRLEGGFCPQIECLLLLPLCRLSLVSLPGTRAEKTPCLDSLA